MEEKERLVEIFKVVEEYAKKGEVGFFEALFNYAKDVVPLEYERKGGWGYEYFSAHEVETMPRETFWSVDEFYEHVFYTNMDVERVGNGNYKLHESDAEIQYFYVCVKEYYDSYTETIYVTDGDTVYKFTRIYIPS